MQRPNTYVSEFDALGTHWWLTFFDADQLHASNEVVRHTVQQFEQHYSRFRSDSLVSQLNTYKELTHPSTEFVDILRTCLSLYDETDGLFNISVGALLENIGYGSIRDSRAHISKQLHDNVIVSNEVIRLSASTRIDLGGIGKGWLIDKLNKVLKEYAPAGYIINGGGDMYVSSPTPTTIALEHPFDDTQHIGTTELRVGALAVSSPHKRTWEHQGATKQHIIHPTNDTAHTKFVSAYVQASTALTADVMATILLIADEHMRSRLCQTFAIEYLLIKQDLTYILTPHFQAHMH